MCKSKGLRIVKTSKEEQNKKFELRRHDIDTDINQKIIKCPQKDPHIHRILIYDNAGIKNQYV